MTIKVVSLKQLKKIAQSGKKFEITDTYFGKHDVSASLREFDERRLFNPALWEPNDLVNISYTVGEYGSSRADMYSKSKIVEAHRLKFMISIKEVLPAEKELKRLLK